MTADTISRLNEALSGLYKIERKLGEGGTANVFLAHDLKHERKVAVKVLRPELAAAVGEERFLAEIRTTASLQHPGILPLHDSGAAHGFLYYVMPYVQGATLRDRIASEGALPFTEAVRITSEIASALEYAHGQGVIHRDVKPANILLSQGHAVLADFGLSKALQQGQSDDLTRTGGPGGTARYMSPEQMRGDPVVDGRSDQYALGCVVYEMLSGEPLFKGRTAWAVIAGKMSGGRTSVLNDRSGLPVGTDGVIARALASDPTDRFDGVGDFAQALSAVTGSTGLAGSTGLGTGARTVAVVAAILAVGLVFSRSTGPEWELDSDRIVVFPLVDQRRTEAGGVAGEQLAILVGTALEHAEPLRWVDGWDWLEPALRSDMSSWSIDRGIAIARARGARHVVDGRILSRGDSIQVMLRLHDATDATLSLTSVQTGTVDELPALGQRAVVTFLPELIDAGRVVETGALDAYEPSAVAEWLNGEREYRNSRFGSALGHFRRAMADDSTMAIAALRGSQAARWLYENREAAALIEVTLQREASLTPRQALLARGIRSYFLGDATVAERDLLDAIARDPTWSDAWMALGEVYYHLKAERGSGLAQAEEAFRSAVEHDPGFTPALVHLAELAFRRGDADRGDSLRLALPTTAEGAALTMQLDLMSRCVRSELDASGWSEAAGSEEGGLAVLYAATHLAAGGAHPECALDAFSALAAWGSVLDGGGPRAIDYSWSLFLGLQSLNTAMGDHDEVFRLITSAWQFERQQDYIWVVQTVADSPFEEEAEEAARRLEQAPELSPTALWAIGVWNALRGDPATVEHVAGIAHERGSRMTSGTVPDSQSLVTETDSAQGYALLGEVLDGWSALALADTIEAVERFTSARAVAPPNQLEWTLWEPLAAERLQLARLLLARGDLAAAIEAAESLDHPQSLVSITYVAESLRVRLHAARAQGDEERTGRYEDRLRRLSGGS